MFGKKVTYEKRPVHCTPRLRQRGPRDLFVPNSKPDDINYQYISTAAAASFVLDVRGFVNGICARGFVACFCVPHVTCS